MTLALLETILPHAAKVARLRPQLLTNQKAAFGQSSSAIESSMLRATRRSVRRHFITDKYRPRSGGRIQTL